MTTDVLTTTLSAPTLLIIGIAAGKPFDISAIPYLAEPQDFVTDFVISPRVGWMNYDNSTKGFTGTIPTNYALGDVLLTVTAGPLASPKLGGLYCFKTVMRVEPVGASPTQTSTASFSASVVSPSNSSTPAALSSISTTSTSVIITTSGASSATSSSTVASSVSSSVFSSVPSSSSSLSSTNSAPSTTNATSISTSQTSSTTNSTSTSSSSSPIPSEFSTPAALNDLQGVYMRAFSFNQNQSQVIAGYTQVNGTYPSGFKTMQFAKSFDRGLTWQLIVDKVPTHYPKFKQPQSLFEVDNASILQLLGGKIIYAFRNHDVKIPNTRPVTFTRYHITLVASTDYGITWNYLATIVEVDNSGGGLHGVWEPFLRLKADGTTIQCYFAQELGDTGNYQNIMMSQSTDSGATWSTATAVIGLDAPNSRDGMPGVAIRNAANPQQLICVFEAQATTGGPFKVSFVTSDDDGGSWSSRSDAFVNPSRNASSGAPQVNLVGTTLVLSFMSGTTSNYDGQNFLVLTSTDQGLSWDGPATISAGAHWPGLYTLDANTFLAMYRQDAAGALITQQKTLPVVSNWNGVYMRATPLTQGGVTSLIAGYTYNNGISHTMQVRKSTDGGTTWSFMGAKAQSATPFTIKDMDNANVLQLPSGRVLYAFRNHDKNSAGDYTRYRIAMVYSDDFGVNWAFMSAVVERDSNTPTSDQTIHNGLWEPFLRLNHDNTQVQCYYGNATSSISQGILMKFASVTVLQGASQASPPTWSAAILVGDHGAGNNEILGTPSVARTSITNNMLLICIFEAQKALNTQYRIEYVLSADDGATWNTRTVLYTADSGSAAGAPQAALVGNTLAVGFMTGVTSPAGSRNYDGTEFRLIARTGFTSASPWTGLNSASPHLTVAAVGAHSPGLLAVDSTHLLLMYHLDSAAGMVTSPILVSTVPTSSATSHHRPG